MSRSSRGSALACPGDSRALRRACRGSSLPGASAASSLPNLLRWLLTLIVAATALVVASPAFAFDAQREASNLLKTQERFRYDHSSPEYQLGLRVEGAREALELAALLVGSPGRNPLTLCAVHNDGCAGDVRMYDWGRRGLGLVVPVEYANRNGAVVSGHLWATLPDDPKAIARRPLVVITNGSIQAPEQLYWHAAQTLAQHGYVVLTWDPQGQGRSDTFGSGETLLRGVPAQQAANFVEGTEDALDFALSTPEHPYTPRGPGAARQRELVAAGRSPKNNPLHALVDATRVGIAGHSLGAFAVSQISASDPRVDAVVAWDNLQPPSPPLKPRVPALGISNDYGLVVTPFTSDPDPEARNRAFAAYKQAGIDAMQVNIRGGTHYESSYIPNPAFPATLRGIDLVDWYTLAWFDRYVKGEARAVKRILSDRWRADAKAASVDPTGDGNLFSFYFRSPVAITTPEGRFECSDLRGGCEGRLVPRARDGFAADWSFLSERVTPSGDRGDADGRSPNPRAARGDAGPPARRPRARPLRRAGFAVGRIAYLRGRTLTVSLRCVAPRGGRCRAPAALTLTIRRRSATVHLRLAGATLVPGGRARLVRVRVERALLARALGRAGTVPAYYELRSDGRRLSAGRLAIVRVSKRR